MATLEDKVRFLSDPESYPHKPTSVDVIETHMSWVFLAGDLVYKFKKPVAFSFLNHTSLEARRRNCEVEYRDNLALAENTYLRVAPLRCNSRGHLRWGTRGRIVEWLVVMRRLDRQLTLEAQLENAAVTRAQIQAIAARMIAHYTSAPARSVNGSAYLDHLAVEMATNCSVLKPGAFGLDQELCSHALAQLTTCFEKVRPELEARITAGLMVDGHGDLRPEHIWLGAPLQIFDRLEFDPTMRIIDPYDELNYLGLECAMAGAEWVGPTLIDVLKRDWGHPPSAALLEFYTAFRAVLRARICVAHLLDPEPMTPEIWPGAARAYLKRSGSAGL